MVDGTTWLMEQHGRMKRGWNDGCFSLLGGVSAVVMAKSLGDEMYCCDCKGRSALEKHETFLERHVQGYRSHALEPVLLCAGCGLFPQQQRVSIPKRERETERQADNQTQRERGRGRAGADKREVRTV